MRVITLTRGLETLVDDEDYDLCAAVPWVAHSAQGRFYARRTVQAQNVRTQIFLHRLIMGAVKGQVVDHINRDSLDNRRANLRFCDTAQNAWNSVKQTKSASGYRGVSWHPGNRQWLATIKARGRNHHLGGFSDPLTAAHAYDAGARKHHGAFATLNFPEASQ